MLAFKRKEKKNNAYKKIIHAYVTSTKIFTLNGNNWGLYDLQHTVATQKQ